MASSRSFAALRTNFEDDLKARVSSPASHTPPELQLRPRSRLRISWDPEIIPRERTQKQVKNYRSKSEAEPGWWEDPYLIQACEGSLTTPGPLLDALTGLTSAAVNRITANIPVQLMNMILHISWQVADAEEVLWWQDDTATDDAPIRATDEELSQVVVESKTDDHAKLLKDYTDQILSHQRVLLEYLDSRLHNFIFCRYQGTIRRPAVCPKTILSTEEISVVDQATRDHGPTACIVSFWDINNRPLLCPIRFSQAYMGMKLHRLGQDPKPWIKSLDGHAGYFDRNANHYTDSESWIADDRLLVRTQSWIYAHELNAESKRYVQTFLNGEHLPAYDGNRVTSWECRHLASALNNQTHMFDFDKPEDSAKLQQCSKCALEYRIDVIKTIPLNWTAISPHTVGDAFCAVVTVWRDFGRCLTPYDPRWSAHFIEYEENAFIESFPSPNQKARNPIEEEPASDLQLGRIMRAFEGGNDLDVMDVSWHRCILKLMLSTDEERSKEIGREREKRSRSRGG